MDVKRIEGKIKQLIREDQVEILGDIVLRRIREELPGAREYVRRINEAYAGPNCAYMEPRKVESLALREILNTPFEVRYALSQEQSPPGSEVGYDIFLGRESESERESERKRISIAATQDELEGMLKAEIKALNQVGLHLEYAGRYVPPR